MVLQVMEHYMRCILGHFAKLSRPQLQDLAVFSVDNACVNSTGVSTSIIHLLMYDEWWYLWTVVFHCSI